MRTTFLTYPSLTLEGVEGPNVVALGTFDGIHGGHAAVVAQARRVADELGLPCTVFTFVDHPRTVLRPDQPVPLLTPWDEKVEALARIGVDRAVGVHFTPGFAQLSPREFVTRILVEQLHARHVISGWNFAFGHGQAGNGTVLGQLGAELGFDVSVHPPVLAGHEPISSSRIRQLLATGDVVEANSLLGRPYSLTGLVVEGDQRGRQLGFPTANLHVPERKLMPAYGVYAGHVRLGDLRRPCVVNLGMRPTFDPPQLRVEAHVLDFSGDLYGEALTIDLEHRLRPEAAFPNVQALVAQIGRDVAEARELLAAPGTPRAAALEDAC